MDKDIRISKYFHWGLILISLCFAGALYFKDLHYAEKIILFYLWKVVVGLVAFVGTLILIFKNGLLKRENLNFVGIQVLIIAIFAGVMAWAGDHRKPSAIAQQMIDEGWDAFNKNHLDEATAHFEDAIRTNSELAYGYYGLGYVQANQNKLDEAVTNFKKSIELEPKHADSYVNLGLALIYRGDLSAGYKALAQAESIAPENPDLVVDLALYYFLAKDYTKAWEYIHKAQVLKASIKADFIRDLSQKMPEPVR